MIHRSRTDQFLIFLPISVWSNLSPTLILNNPDLCDVLLNTEGFLNGQVPTLVAVEDIKCRPESCDGC